MHFARVLLATLMFSVSCAVVAQAFPVKPVRLVLRSPPGGTDDLLGRLLAQKMPETLGQQVVVDYRTGAGGLVAWEIVAKAPPDGYTLLLAASGLGAVKSLRPDATIDPWRDYTWISQVVNYQLMLVAHPTLPVKTLKDLIALARSRPGQLSFSSSGTGSSLHLAGELLKSMGKIDMVHVPYKGASNAMVDVLSGQVQLMFASVATALPHIRQGRAKALAVTTEMRFALLPEIPTMAEAGLPDYVMLNWLGLVAPDQTPSSVVSTLNLEIAKWAGEEESRQKMLAQGLMPGGGTPAQFEEVLVAGYKSVGDIVKRFGIRLQ